MSEKEKKDEGGDFVEGNVVEHNVGSWWQDLSVKNKIFMIVSVRGNSLGGYGIQFFNYYIVPKVLKN